MYSDGKSSIYDSTAGLSRLTSCCKFIFICKFV